MELVFKQSIILLILVIVTALPSGLETSSSYLSPSSDGIQSNGQLLPHSDGEDYDEHPEYRFEYGVRDDSTGDYKIQSESRKDDVVRGHYEVLDADGFKRIVEYTADDVNGFVATVQRIPVNFVQQHNGEQQAISHQVSTNHIRHHVELQPSPLEEYNLKVD